MRKLFLFLPAIFLLTTSFQENKTKIAYPKKSTVTITKPIDKLNINTTEELYKSFDFGGNILSEEIFTKAITGFENLKKSGKISPGTRLLTVCDFSKSSNEKRMWILDLEGKKILFNNLVAHGKNTGEEFAQNFSNEENSLKTSLGFYITEETYTGENGYSLKLSGMDEGYNDHAMTRNIVMHGADYVSEDFAKTEKRIGRSWGCPAVPRQLAEPIINTIKSGSVLFIYFPDADYLKNSKWLSEVKN